MKANKTISTISTILVFSLAAVAFTLSFDALRTLAAANGIAPRLSVLFPLAVDGFILAAALASLRANLYGERALYPSALIVVFTLASVILNIAHSNGVLDIPRRVLATIVAAVPPVALVLASELLFAQLRSTVELRDATHTLSDVRSLVADLTLERDKVRNANKRLRERGVKLAEMIEGRKEELDTMALGPVGALLEFYADNPRATQAEAAGTVGRSRQWVGQRLAEMESAGRIKRNGDGIEICERLSLVGKPIETQIEKEKENV